MILNQCHHKNQFHTKVLLLLKSYLIHVHLKSDAFTISSLRILGVNCFICCYKFILQYVLVTLDQVC